MKLRLAALVLIGSLAAACAGEAGHEVSGAIGVENVGFLLTADEVEEYGRDGLEIEANIVGYMDRARESGANVESTDDWVGIDFAESVDGARVNFALIDLVDGPSAHARFDELAEEFILVESDQGIGERFAGLSPQTGDLHTITMFLVGDKVVVITTTTSLVESQPLLTSEQLVEIARLVAPRIIP